MARIFSLLMLLMLPAAAPAQSLPIPELHARVTDNAGLLKPAQVQALESRLQQLERSDSTQIGILILASLEGESLEDYSIRVAEKWRLGQKGRDNGVLLIFAMAERELRIEVGYGLEPTLTDYRSSQIIRNEIAPYFRQGDYYRGIDVGVSGIIQVVRGVYQATPAPAQRSQRSSRRGTPIVMLLFILLPILSYTGKWGGGILGIGAGALLPYFLLSAGLPFMIIGGLLGGGLGAVVGALVQAGAGSGGGRGGFGGPFFPGGFGGGGGISGGFGGFSGGGGGFGGGGASGRW